MGIRVYCKTCKDMVHVSLYGRCVKCGGNQIDHSNKVLDSEWELLSDEEKIDYIRNLCVSEESPEPPSEDIDEVPIDAAWGLVSQERAPVEKITAIEMMTWITTCPSFEGRKIDRYLGTVFGSDIYLVGGLIGGGLANQEKLFGVAFASAKKKMCQKALDLGGNAIVGMQTTVTSPGSLANMIVIVTGTAVHLATE